MGSNKSLELPEAKKFMKLVSSIGAFGLDSTFRGKEQKSEMILKSTGTGVSGMSQDRKLRGNNPSSISGKSSLVALLPAPQQRHLPAQNHQHTVHRQPGSISSWTYMYIGPFDSKKQAESVLSYLLVG